MLIPSLALITILFLLLVWATIRERVMAKEIKLAKQFYAASGIMPMSLYS